MVSPRVLIWDLFTINIFNSKSYIDALYVSFKYHICNFKYIPTFDPTLNYRHKNKIPSLSYLRHLRSVWNLKRQKCILDFSQNIQVLFCLSYSAKRKPHAWRSVFAYFIFLKHFLLFFLIYFICECTLPTPATLFLATIISIRIE